jgi:CRP-like cAMP-binding protein
MLQPVPLSMRQVLHRPGEPMGAVHFPRSGWVSLIALLEDGDAAEIGLVGREGMVGLPLLLGAESTMAEAMVQNDGTAFRIGSADFARALDLIPAFRALLLRYAMAQHEQVARTAACNGRHLVEQRLARWLLMAHDRAHGDDFPMTHEFLSMMLGVRRAGVSVAAALLQRAGLIHYARGRISVCDRPGLEAAACGCYAALRQQWMRVLPEHEAGRG